MNIGHTDLHILYLPHYSVIYSM